MIKNKDGSYNLISLGILAAIGIIGILMLASVLITDKPDVDFVTVLSYGGMITCLLLIFYFGKRVLSKLKLSNPSPIPIKNELTKSTNPIIVASPIEIARYKNMTSMEIDKRMNQVILESDTNPSKQSASSFNIINVIISFVIGAVLLIVGSGIIKSIQSAIPDVSQNPQLSSQMTAITETTDSAFNIMGIGILILSIMMIVGLFMGMLRNN